MSRTRSLIDMNRFFPYHQIRKIKAVYWYLDISYIFSLFLHYDEQVILMIETIIDSIAVALEDPFKIFIFVFSTTTENVKLKWKGFCCVRIRTISHVGEEAGTLNGNCITFRLSSPPPPYSVLPTSLLWGLSFELMPLSSEISRCWRQLSYFIKIQRQALSAPFRGISTESPKKGEHQNLYVSYLPFDLKKNCTDFNTGVWKCTTLMSHFISYLNGVNHRCGASIV